MVNPSLSRELLEQLERLTTDQQRKVLDFARALPGLPKQGTAEAFLKLFGTMHPDEAKQMINDIEAECERVDPDGW